jgi:NAD-dependent DNA ligase
MYPISKKRVSRSSALKCLEYKEDEILTKITKTTNNDISQLLTENAGGRLKTVKRQDKELNECLVQQQEPKREELNFENDGIVVKVNNYDFYQQLGQTKSAETKYCYGM